MMDTETLLEEFYDRQSTKKAETTAYSYKRQAAKWADWLENPGKYDYDNNRSERESKKVWEATTGDLQTFLRQQLNSGLSGMTVRNRRFAISALYRELDEMANEPFPIPDFENPSNDLDVSDWGLQKKGTRKSQALKGEEVYYLTPDEIEQLTDNVTDPTLRNELIIRLLYQTGLRRGELASIRLEDIDTDERAINIRAEKTHSNRIVYYQPSLDTLLNRWINVGRKSLTTADSDYLFPTYKTEKITGRQVSRTVRKAAEEAGLQGVAFTDASGGEHVKITAHTLRHSFAVQSVKNGMDTRMLQLLLGHENIETTERYLRMATDDIQSAARKFGAGTEK